MMSGQLTLLLFFVASSIQAADLPNKLLCPAETELREAALRKWGKSEDVTWESLAIPEKLGSNQYCYERTVWVVKPTLINWPRAGIQKLVVKDKIITATCCWPGARPEDGPLEYGFTGKTIQTTVFRGHLEPGPTTNWMAVSGFLYHDGTTSILDVTAFTKVSADACTHQVSNAGGDVYTTVPISTTANASSFLLKGRSIENLPNMATEVWFQPMGVAGAANKVMFPLEVCNPSTWRPITEK